MEWEKLSYATSSYLSFIMEWNGRRDKLFLTSSLGRREKYTFNVFNLHVLLSVSHCRLPMSSLVSHKFSFFFVVYNIIPD